MPKSRRKIWALYELMSEKELQHCGAWVRAHTGGDNSKIYTLFSALHKSKNDQIIWESVYPGQAYNDNRLRFLFHELIRIVEDYIAFQQFKETPFLRDLFLIKGLNRKGLADTFRYFVKKIKKKWEKQPIRNSRYFWAMYELEGENSHFANKFPDAQKVNYIVELESQLEKALALDIMRNRIFSLGNKTSIRLEDRSMYLENLGKESMSSRVLRGEGLIDVYRSLLEFLTRENAEGEKLIQMIKDIWDAYDIKDQNKCLAGDKAEYLNLCYLILNRLTYLSNRNPKKEYWAIQFDFYSWLIEQELLLVDGYLAPTHYRNVITIGLSLKKWTEVDIMIDNYAVFLEEKNRQELQIYTRGRYYFYLKRFDLALPRLSQKYRSTILDLNARIYTIQTFYEMQSLENVGYHISLLKSYIQRKKNLSEDKKGRYLAKVSYLEQLFKANSPEAYLGLKNRIEERNDAANPQWIIDKCQEKIGADM